MNDAKDFPYPLDTDIDEQIPVKKLGVTLDDKGNARVSQKTVMTTQRVRYMNVPKVKHRCKDGEHIFKVLDSGKYLFSCTQCPFVRKVYPASYRFEESSGKLIHRYTGQVV